METDYEVLFTESARQDLNNTLQWISEYSEEVAHRVVDNLEARCKATLAVTPQAGHVFSNNNNVPMYRLVIRGYSLFYQLHEVERRVYVLRVFREVKGTVPNL